MAAPYWKHATTDKLVPLQFFAEDLITNLGIGLAADLLHQLANKENP